MAEKDQTDKKFEEMYNYFMDQAGSEASYGGGYSQSYDPAGGHTKEEADAEYDKLFRELHGVPEDDEVSGAQNNVFVIGHINPDTDSIVASIAYARLKNEIDKTATYIPKRAGRVNEETQYVLDSVGMEAPDLMADAGSQIMDIDIRDLPGVPDSITLKWAWELLKEKNIVTLPITEKETIPEDAGSESEGSRLPREKLKGVITVKDIGHIYMDAVDPDLLSQAHTSYENIREAINGKIVVDNNMHMVKRGKVVVATADSEMLSDFVEEGDIVIVSNRSESLKDSIEAGADLIIVAMGVVVNEDMIRLALDNNCAVITTNLDTYTTARLMNQSIPVRFAMIDEKLITFKTTDNLDYVKKVMSKQKHRDFPVLDEDGYYVGMISRRFLVDAKRKKMILVDHNEKSQAIEDINNAEILEIIDHHRLSSVETIEPVFFRNEPVGSTSSIIYEMYKENGLEVDRETAQILCAGILSDTLMFKSPTTSQKDKLAAIELSGLAGIDMVNFASSMFRAGSASGDKHPDELINQDFKKFTADGTHIGIGQYNSMDVDELTDVRERITGSLDEERQKKNLDMIFFMLTDIVAGKTEVLFAGEDAKGTLEEAFEVSVDEDSLIVEGLISRKKQMVPEIISAMQQ